MNDDQQDATVFRLFIYS